jgi:hypothetical protein
MDRGEFQQDSVLKQLEVLKEEEKEFQNLKVRVVRDYKMQHLPLNLDHRSDGPNPIHTENLRKQKQKARGQPADLLLIIP